MPKMAALPLHPRDIVQHHRRAAVTVSHLRDILFLHKDTWKHLDPPNSLRSYHRVRRINDTADGSRADEWSRFQRVQGLLKRSCIG